jgi:hypothetical protein
LENIILSKKESSLQLELELDLQLDLEFDQNEAGSIPPPFSFIEKR